MTEFTAGPMLVNRVDARQVFFRDGTRRELAGRYSRLKRRNGDLIELESGGNEAAVTVLPGPVQAERAAAAAPLSIPARRKRRRFSPEMLEGLSSALASGKDFGTIVRPPG